MANPRDSHALVRRLGRGGRSVDAAAGRPERVGTGGGD